MASVGRKGRPGKFPARRTSPRKVCVVNLENSNSSDGEEPPPPPPPAAPLNAMKKKDKPFIPSPIDDSWDDIFDINYSAHSSKALRGAFKELHAYEKEHTGTKMTPRNDSDSDDCVVVEEQHTPTKTQDMADTCARPPSPTLFDIGDHPAEDQGQTTTRKRRNRAAKSRPESLKKKLRLNESLNLSSDVHISDDEEEVNPEINVLIKWGSERFRLPIRKLQKFSHLYGVLAQRYGVEADYVVLNLKDKIINPTLCPEDLQVTIADVIEGGIGSLPSSSGGQLSGPQTTAKDPSSISLRVQNSNRKGSVTITVGLSEKMNVLMHKYAEEKQIQIDKLRFMFDGEKLDPQSTPSSLALEEGECIDVYELT